MDSRSATLADEKANTSDAATPRNSTSRVESPLSDPEKNHESSALDKETQPSPNGATAAAGEGAGVDEEIVEEKEANEVAEEGEDEYPQGVRLAFIIIALILSIFLVALDFTIVATAIPKIEDDFGDLSKVGWYGAAFFVTTGAFQSTWGKAFKYFSLKLGFLLTIGIFEVGSLICGRCSQIIVQQCRE